MSPQTKVWRESFIRYCALRLRYHRAWQTGKANICDLAALLGKVEEAGETCRLLMPDEEVS
ncbi:hypothetical protein BOM25_13440 [Serratia sp. OPWLW2]|nr:hypothetical protein BOM25_13440 [Serratia sp. OPWLW2]